MKTLNYAIGSGRRELCGSRGYPQDLLHVSKLFTSVFSNCLSVVLCQFTLTVMLDLHTYPHVSDCTKLRRGEKGARPFPYYSRKGLLCTICIAVTLKPRGRCRREQRQIWAELYLLFVTLLANRDCPIRV